MEKACFKGIFDLCTKLCTLSTGLIQKKNILKFRTDKRLFCKVVTIDPKKVGIAFKYNYQKILIVMRKIQKTLPE